MDSEPPSPCHPRYVMLNDQKPPPQRRHVPRYKSRGRNSPGACCLKCICCCYCFLFILILLLVTAVVVFFTINKPQKPTYDISQVEVKAFKIHKDLSVYTQFIVSVKADNPNPHIGFIYGKDSSVNVLYTENTLCSGTLPSFHQPGNNISMMNITMEGQNVLDSGLREDLLKKKKEKKIPILVTVKAPISLVIAKFPLRQFSEKWEALWCGGANWVSACGLSKKLIKRVQCRLKLLKNKRNSIVKQLREDMAQLIKLGYEETAFKRAEQLFKDESILAVYDMLDSFCEFINIQLSYIRRNKDCPNDINEAVSSLIFASARCADLPELPAIRKLFGERYGQRFATAAVELLPGNLVNREIQEKLSIKSVSDDAKYRLFDEIVRDHCQKQEILAIEYIPEMQKPVKEISLYQEVDSKCEESQTQTSDSNETEDGKSIQVDTLAICTSLNSSQLEKMESPVETKAEKVANYPQTDSLLELTFDLPGEEQTQKSSSICTNTLEDQIERIKAPSSPESLPESEDIIIYLDDIEELKSSKKCQDQRLFKFKSPTMPKAGSYEGFDDLQNDKSSPRTFIKSRSPYGKKSRRRSFCVESPSMKETDHELYYEKPCKSSPSHKHKSHNCRKLPKKIITFAETEQSDYVLKRQIKHPGCNSHFTCSLENPCYFCTGDDEEEQFPTKNQNRGLRNSGQVPISDGEEDLDDQFCHCQCSCHGETKFKNEIGVVAQTPGRRSYDNGARVHECFSLPRLEKEKTIGKVKGYGSLVSMGNSQTRNEAVGPYLRAMTMPQERPSRESHMHSILRSNSLSFPNSNHVHPKLPDYDDLSAKFMALKKQNLLYNQ
ncbi:Late embryogenesis abundant protein, LEA-14 [Corchorus capsularis]|uniref:Late embryogenesis abundant protein, LEA-14 n=1 Tax=Corchorus capsularis TaxID=210143 RepID=A0A1R3GNR8_COCAP|nr:Late embryogenesis abundant protein, LEA-14 [Corchorus capsularis]